jgi:hypothetical protein
MITGRVTSEMRKSCSRSIKSTKRAPIAKSRANPQSALAVFTDRIAPVATQRVGVIGITTVMNEDTGVLVELIKPRIRCSNPNLARPILIERKNLVAAYAAGVPGIMSIMPKSHVVRPLPASSNDIEPVEAAPLGAHPDRPFAIFEHGPDYIAAQAVRIPGIVLEMREHPGLSIEPLQATPRRNPHLA